MNFTAAAWLWLYLAAFLMLAELISPGFVIFFFGLGAATVAACKWAFPHLSLAWQLALFSFFSILHLVLLRRFMKRLFMSGPSEADKIESEYVGRIGEVREPTSKDVPGRIVLGDAEWTAVSENPIPAGVKVKVVKQANLTFTVEPLA